MAITLFRGKYAFLSNMYPHGQPFELDGRKFPSAEHAYMSFKANDSAWKDLCASRIHSPQSIKSISRTVKLVPDWEEIKVSVMRRVLAAKFSADASLAQQLIATGDEILMEGNAWGDHFWGVDLQTLEGKNQLGILLMELRTKLQKQHDTENSKRD